MDLNSLCLTVELVHEYFPAFMVLVLGESYTYIVVYTTSPSSFKPFIYSTDFLWSPFLMVG